MSAIDLSLVIPVYNEVESLTPLIDELYSVLRLRDWRFEILFVNDGSDDGSAERIDALAASRPEIRGIHLDRNYGQTAAFDAGFARARGHAIVTLDADGQNDPRDIPALVEGLAEHDIVAGYRIDREDRWLRRVSSQLANAVRNRVIGEAVIDSGCSLKAFRASAVTELLVYSGMHRFIATRAALRGLSLSQYPVRHRPRRFGRSKYGVHNRLWVGLVDLFAMRWMQRRRLRYVVLKESAAATVQQRSRSSRHEKRLARPGETLP